MMIGQGSPRTSWGRFASHVRASVCRGRRLALAVFLAIAAAEACGSEPTIRVRIAWGGGAERLWLGQISVSQGKLSEPRSLGIEADEPGSMWLEAGPLPMGAEQTTGVRRLPADGAGQVRLVIRQRSPRSYDGVDLLVAAEADARLLIQLSGADDPGPPERIEVPLAQLLGGSHNTKLDDYGNRLFVSRTPGDMLRVHVPRRSLVFGSGELLEFELLPHLLPGEPGSQVQIKTELVAAAGGEVLWSTEQSVWLGRTGPIRQEIVLPAEEGVYDVVLTASLPAGIPWAESVAGPLNWKKRPLAQRKIQVLVLGAEPPAEPAATDATMGQVVEIDPANPKWWERFAKLPTLGRTRRLLKVAPGPLGNGNVRTRAHALGQLVELGPAKEISDPAWEAYTLPINEPGRPHVLEIDYPSDVPQTMGISILEPNVAGAVLPMGLDSGVDLGEEMTGGGDRPQWLHHRVIFWPRTKAPMVLITNLRDGTPAVYGKIRVLSGSARLPRAFPAGGPPPGRLLGAYLDRPLFPENFSAGEALGSLSDLGVDDWRTFYEGGTRLVEYLNHVGFGGLMISAAADGSAIYPSELLQPTPRYDTGVFMDMGQDPFRKDVLEMLYRLFDRQGLQLTSALEFGAPLPELEAVLRRGGPESVGIRWVGPRGLTWQEVYPPERGMGPYYNVLHPRVQEAMLAVIRELVGNYSDHASFGGVAIHLSAHGYAQLAGPEWGMDDATMARFERDTGLRVGGEGPERFAQRAHILTSGRGVDSQHGRAWLAWRAGELSRFYRGIQAELEAARPGARLYLAGANMLSGEPLRRQLRPALPQTMTLGEVLLQVGIDLGHYRAADGPVLLRPEQISPEWSLSEQAVNVQIGQLLDEQHAADRQKGPSNFHDVWMPGSLFFHKPQELRLASFDEKSPYQPSYAWLAAEPVPSGPQNRRRFVHSLAKFDSQVMFDGGWQLPMGQEDSIRDLVAAYRRLPAVRFERLENADGATPWQPVTIRYATQGESTYVYVVNDAPFSTTARVQLTSPTGCQLEELSGSRQVPPLRRDADGTYWSVDLEPYDLVAVRLSAPGVKLFRPQATYSDDVQTTLKRRLDDVADRVASLGTPPILDALVNPGFELPATADGRIPGWAASNQEGTFVGLDVERAHGGRYATHVASTGPVATLISEPFDPPATGRLEMAVWLRGPDTPGQFSLRLALVGKLNGRDFFRLAEVGQSAGGQSSLHQLEPGWREIEFQADDLPLTGLSRLQVRFDLLGPGEVWIDDVQLCKLAFSEKERWELRKLIAPAEWKREKGEVGDCLELLEGYWPRFLLANVPPGPAAAHRREQAAGPLAREAPKKPVETTGVLDRVKNWLPEPLRF